MRKHTALLTVCMTFLLVAFSVFPTYAADTPVTGNINNLDVSTIDISRPVRLSVVKTPHNPYNATEASPTPRIDGVTITLRRIEDLNLREYAAWQTLTSSSINALTQRNLSAPTKAITDRNGVAVFDSLPVGVYIIQEGAPVDGGNFDLADPFVITLPTGNADGTDWNYDVSVMTKGAPKLHPEPFTPTPPPTPPVPPTPPAIPITGAIPVGSAVVLCGALGAIFVTRRKSRD